MRRHTGVNTGLSVTEPACRRPSSGVASGASSVFQSTASGSTGSPVCTSTSAVSSSSSTCCMCRFSFPMSNSHLKCPLDVQLDILNETTPEDGRGSVLQ